MQSSPDHGRYEGVHVGVGRYNDPIGLVRGDTRGVDWQAEVRAAWRDKRPDFRGPYVDGKRGDRDIYLDWLSRKPNGQLKLLRRGMSCSSLTLNRSRGYQQRSACNARAPALQPLFENPVYRVLMSCFCMSRRHA